MNIFSFSASHHDLDLDLLERLGAASGQVGRALVDATGESSQVRVAGSVVLATCNRLEIYVDADVPGLAVPAHDEVPAALGARVARAVAAATDLTPDEVTAALRPRAGRAAATHLLEVASGLDSMVVGEREIAGQVRRSLGAARRGGTTSGDLTLLFEHSSRVSRRIEAATGLGAVGRSVVGVGLDLAGAHLPPWRQTRAVLIGTGSYAGACLAALRARGCADVRVYSRSGRAESFAKDRGVDAVAGDGLVDALADADLVVSCSGTIGAVVDAAAVRSARERAVEAAEDRAHEPDPVTRPLVLLDLALRRDVEVDVADVEGVLLFDLASIRAHAPAAGPEPVRRARELVAAGVDELAVLDLERRVGRAARQEIEAASADAAADVERERARHAAAGLTHGALERALRPARRAAGARRHERILAAKAAARARLAASAPVWG